MVMYSSARTFTSEQTSFLKHDHVDSCIYVDSCMCAHVYIIYIYIICTRVYTYNYIYIWIYIYTHLYVLFWEMEQTSFFQPIKGIVMWVRMSLNFWNSFLFVLKHSWSHRASCSAIRIGIQFLRKLRFLFRSNMWPNARIHISSSHPQQKWRFVHPDQHYQWQFMELSNF